MASSIERINPAPQGEVVRRIVFSALQEPASNITLVEEQGNVNRAYDVMTRSGSVIVRVRFDRDELRQFERERYCADVIRAQYNWTPEVLAIGKFEGHCYSVQRKVFGTVASRYSGDMVAVWEQVGRYAALFHAIETPGYLNAMLGKRPPDPYEWCQPYLDYLGVAEKSKLVADELMTRVEFEAALEIIGSLKNLHFKPTLAHGNLSPKNIIVDSEGTAHIIDWGSCQGHMAELLDLSELLAFETPRAHVQAYLRGHGLPPDYDQRNHQTLECLKLVRCLTNAHWLCDGQSPRRADLLKYVERARSSIQLLS